MSETTQRIATNDYYTFKVVPESAVTKVYVGSLYTGWVSNGDSSGGMPDRVVTAARAFLYEVKPELNPDVIFQRKGTADAPVVAPKPKPGDCCDAMRLVLPRTELLQHKHGIGIMELINTDTGVIKRYVSLKFPKNPDKLAPHAKTTTIALNFCPFCGAALDGEKEESFDQAENVELPHPGTAVATKTGSRGKEKKADGGARRLQQRGPHTAGRAGGKK